MEWSTQVFLQKLQGAWNTACKKTNGKNPTVIDIKEHMGGEASSFTNPD